MKEYPWGKGTPKWVRDATANDSDKSFTVPAGKIWQPIYCYMLLAASATVGNRVLRYQVNEDGTNMCFATQTGNIAASSSNACALMFGASDQESGFSGVTNLFNLPLMYLTAGAVIRIYDTAAIDVAADDLTVVLHYVEYDA